MRRVSQNRSGGSYGRAVTAFCAVTACWFLPVAPAVAAAAPSPAPTTAPGPLPSPAPDAAAPAPGRAAADPPRVRAPEEPLVEPAPALAPAPVSIGARSPGSAGSAGSADLEVSGVLRPGASGAWDRRE